MNDIQLEEELAQTRLSRFILHRLVEFLAPYKWTFALVVALELVWVGLVAIGPIVVQRALDVYIPQKATAWLLAACGVYAATILGRWLVAFVQIRLNMRAGQGFLNDLRTAIFRHVQWLSLSYFDRTKHGRIIARADRDVDNLEYPFVWGPIIVVSSVFSLLVASVVMANYSGRLFLAVLGVIPPMLIASEIFRRKGMAAYRSMRESLTRITAYLAENISGVRVVQAFRRESHNAGRFRELNRAHWRNAVRAAVVWNSYFPVIRFLHAVSIVIVIAYGGWLIANGDFTVGKLSAYVFYSWMFFGPILEMSDLYNAMLSGASAAERIFLLLDTQPRVHDRENAAVLRRCNGDIAFSRVYFRYGDDGEWILRDINLHAAAGTSIALVGATGAGKSSIVNLLARFYEPQRGEVRIDGRPHTELTLESLHAHMGIVPQDNYLFSGTVMDNLRYGRPEATDQEIIDVATSLGAHEMIEKFAEGYRTTIKERGGGLSLGERQLICFLRVFVADPRIVILDEATSAVDAHTEAVLQNALRKLVVDRTAVIIAHRLSTIRHADSILVVDQGRIVEAGKHDELIARGGRYYDMYEEYLR